MTWWVLLWLTVATPDAHAVAIHFPARWMCEASWVVMRAAAIDQESSHVCVELPGGA